MIILGNNIDKMSFTLELALEQLIVAQKRTGKSKQYVFYLGDDVVKGPFTKSDKSDKSTRLNNIRLRSKIFDQWKTPLVVKPTSEFEVGGDIYVVYPNLSAGHEIESESYNEEFSGITYNVAKLDTVPVVPVTTALKQNPWIYDEAQDLILALVHCYILGVGDMNLRNCLVNTKTKELYIVDYDDNSSSDKTGDIFYMNKQPAKEYNWFNRTKKHHKYVLEKLAELKEDKLINRSELYTNRYNYAVSQLTGNSGSTYNSNCNLNYNLSNNIVTNSNPPSSSMVWKGLMGGSKTRGGHDIDIMKSGVQKYIRRGEVVKALQSAVELYRFVEIPEAKAIVTNLFNRLAIIASEDISPNNCTLIVEVIKCVESKNYDLYTMMAIVQLLSEATKSRLMSHMWRTYCSGEVDHLIKRYNVEVDTDYTEDDLQFYEDNKEWEVFDDTVDDTMRPLILTFYKRLLEKDNNAFVWVGFFLALHKDSKIKMRPKFTDGRKNKVSKAPILIWDVLSYFLDSETRNTLCEAYFNHTESKPFLQLAILMALRGVKYDKGQKNTLTEYSQLWSQGESKEYVDSLIRGEYELVVDDYVIDKHTLKGKSSGKTIKDFVSDGAHIENSDPEMYDEILSKIYSGR